ncbi:Fe2+-enterobactin ABC transporter substrate-binding protein [Gynuella sp.]|uniref:Fe2+-enterobactin ABC transporter substrate-binding protein n=1 Tax=Gynuella sp. TaxID=2969146 RepID=UPI003D117FDA
MLPIGQLTVLCLVWLLTACHSASEDKHSALPETDIEGWPRTFSTVAGEVTLHQPPHRIVSTSVTLTGSLLAVNAPVIASGGTNANTAVADQSGFFRQWSTVAHARGVKPLYQMEPNAEAIVSVNPDLIIIAATGGDSALKLYDQLASVAPTMVVSYDDKSWQQLARLFGEISGHEQDADELVRAYDQRVRRVHQAIQLPPQPSTALVYYEDGSGANVWTEESAQGRLLKDLGFTLADIPQSVRGNESQGKRHDIVQLSGEKFADGLNGASLLLFAADETMIDQLRQNPFLSHVSAIRNDQLYAMGPDTFRLDYYSSRHMLDQIESLFAASVH